MKFLVGLALLLIAADAARGQFFTKSSKSIPRMGRRSVPDYQNAMEAYRQLMAEDYNEQPPAQPPPQQVYEDYANAERASKLADLLRPRPADEDYAAKLSRHERSQELASLI